MSIQGENPKRNGALDASPNDDTGYSVIPEKVTKVLAIEYYDNPAPSTAILHVVFESGGEKTKGWFKYEKIQRLPGTKEALAMFRPTWI